MFMLLATIVLTPSMFLDDIKTFLLFSGRTINVFPSTFMSANAFTIVFVLISFNSNLSTTVNSFSKTLELNTDFIASLFSFLLTVYLYERGFGPKAIPPLIHCGALIEPCLALPVPFCLHGFLPPPETSALVFVLYVPCL